MIIDRLTTATPGRRITPPRVLIAAAALCLTVACGGGDKPLVFSVTFQEARGLEAGDAVFFRGLEIGQVEDVGLDESGLVRATVEVDPEHRSAIAYTSIIEITESTTPAQYKDVATVVGNPVNAPSVSLTDSDPAHFEVID